MEKGKEEQKRRDLYMVFIDLEKSVKVPTAVLQEVLQKRVLWGFIWIVQDI